MTQATQDMLDALREANFGSAQVVLIMGEVRKQLEAREEWKKKFEVLHFYCDWCMHAQIDRNKYCETLIRELNRCVWQLDEAGNLDTSIPMNVAGFLRIGQLCNELGIVLTAISGDIVYPTHTFVSALFTYLKGVPVVPIDAVGGVLDRTKAAYAALCQDLQIGPNRPLMKNFKITEVEPICLQYEVEMENSATIINGEVEFPLCSEPPFVFLAERQNENKFAEYISNAQQQFFNKQLDVASSTLQKAMALFPNVKGMDEVKAQLYLLTMEVEWARSGDIAVLSNGEKAMDFIADPVRCSNIYCAMAEYALQRVPQMAEALLDVKTYVDKSLELVIYDKLKIRPLHIRGNMFIASKKPDDAMEALTQAAQYADEAHMEAVRARILCDIATVMEMQGHPEMALSEFTHAENVAKSSAEPIVMASCAFRKAQFLIRKGDKDSACKLIANMPKMI